MSYKAPDPSNGWRLVKGDGTEDAPMDMEYCDEARGKWSPSVNRGRKNFFNYCKGSLFYRTREGVKQVKEINYQRLALRMSKAKTIREAREIWKKAVGK